MIKVLVVCLLISVYIFVSAGILAILTFTNPIDKLQEDLDQITYLNKLKEK